jgi:hypothetical protein
VRKLILQMGVSLDGLVARPGRHGAAGWVLLAEDPALTVYATSRPQPDEHFGGGGATLAPPITRARACARGVRGPRSQRAASAEENSTAV